MSEMPMYADADTPITHKIFQRGFSLPSYFDLTKKDVDRVVECVIEIISD
jgi:dTDP-4-amino-4,6-dideoxygalactose transaminase